VSNLPNKGCVLEDLLFVFGCKITELIIHLIEEELGTNSSHVEKTNCNPSLCPHLAGN
jgi:hypothetical protein